jgi:hypothetical protein
MAFMAHLISDRERQKAGCFLPDLKAGYNPIQALAMWVIEEDSNDV